MQIRFSYILSFLLIANTSVVLAQSEVVKFPDEELARESVLPKFKNKPMVLNRNVSIGKKFSVGGDLGITLNEPFNSPLQYGGFINYHFDEVRGIHLLFNILSSSNSTYTDQLNAGGSTNFGLQYRPRPKYMFLGNYQYNAFYGKISLTKKFVVNLMLYGLGGIGLINIGGENYPVLTLGLGQKFYFSKKMALRVDLRSIMYNGPNVVDHTNYNNRGAEVPPAEFGKTLTLSNVLTAGLEVLF